MNRATSDWMAVDWRRGGLRVWVLDAAGAVRARLTGAPWSPGMTRDALERALGGVISGHLDDDAPTEILVTGDVAMPGVLGPEARKVPCTPLDPATLAAVSFRDDRFGLRVVPGLRGTAPPALMLGDAVRVAGFLAVNAGFDGVICLPGARSHWVHVSAGEIVSFQTAVTQVMVKAALTSIGVAPGAVELGEVGLAVMEDVMSRPERIGQKIGSNAAQLALGATQDAATRAAIWGAFLGLELASMKSFWLGQQVALVADDALAPLYRAALGAQGIVPRVMDEEGALLEGFKSLR